MYSTANQVFWVLTHSKKKKEKKKTKAEIVETFT